MLFMKDFKMLPRYMLSYLLATIISERDAMTLELYSVDGDGVLEHMFILQYSTYLADLSFLSILITRSNPSEPVNIWSVRR